MSVVSDKEMLLKAGKLAIAASNVVYKGNLMNLSHFISELQEALEEYNRVVFDATEQRRRK